MGIEEGERRNEALDIFIYNFVALKILNPNFEVLEKNMAGVEVKPLKKVNKPYKIRRAGSFLLVALNKGVSKEWKQTTKMKN